MAPVAALELAEEEKKTLSILLVAYTILQKLALPHPQSYNFCQ